MDRGYRVSDYPRVTFRGETKEAPCEGDQTSLFTASRFGRYDVAWRHEKHRLRENEALKPILQRCSVFQPTTEIQM